MVVSLWDNLEFWDFDDFCSRASFRDAMPSTLRLPRPQRGLAMTQNWNASPLLHRFKLLKQHMRGFYDLGQTR